MEEKAEGIVISSVSYGESDKILNVFTPDKGVISAKIKGVKKAGAKLKFAQEPFCFAEFIFTKKGEYRTIIGASLIDTFYPIRQSVESLYSASVVVEYVKKFLKENIVSPELFMLCITTLKKIAYENKGLTALTKFLVDALRLSGYALNITNECACEKKLNDIVYFNYRTGSFVCENCKDEFCRQINFITYNTLKSVILGEEVSQEGIVKALRLIDYYIANKADEKINSLKELIKLSV